MIIIKTFARNLLFFLLFFPYISFAVSSTQIRPLPSVAMKHGISDTVVNNISYPTASSADAQPTPPKNCPPSYVVGDTVVGPSKSVKSEDKCTKSSCSCGSCSDWDFSCQTQQAFCKSCKAICSLFDSKCCSDCGGKYSCSETKKVYTWTDSPPGQLQVLSLTCVKPEWIPAG